MTARHVIWLAGFFVAAGAMVIPAAAGGTELG